MLRRQYFLEVASDLYFTGIIKEHFFEKLYRKTQWATIEHCIICFDRYFLYYAPLIPAAETPSDNNLPLNGHLFQISFRIREREDECTI